MANRNQTQRVVEIPATDAPSPRDAYKAEVKTVRDMVADIAARWEPGFPCPIIIIRDTPFAESVVAGRTFQWDRRDTSNAGVSECLRYGEKRKVNDLAKGHDAATKHIAAEKIVAAIMDGTVAKPSRGSGAADPYGATRPYIRDIIGRMPTAKAAADKANVSFDIKFKDAFFAALADSNETLHTAILTNAMARRAEDEALMGDLPVLPGDDDADSDESSS